MRGAQRRGTDHARDAGGERKIEHPVADLVVVRIAVLRVSGTWEKVLAPAQVLGSPDPADGHSDHSSFQSRGYAGCAASEDFFPSPGNPEDRNPNYHKVSDRVFDLPFATSIARVICAAALRAAHPAVDRIRRRRGFRHTRRNRRACFRPRGRRGRPAAAGRSHRLAARRRSAGTEYRGPGRSRSGRHLRRRDPARVLSSPRASCRRRLAGVDAPTPLAVEAGRPVQLLLTASPRRR